LSNPRAKSNIVSKNLHNLFLEIEPFPEGGAHMRFAQMIFFGSIAAAAVLTTPALTKNPDAQKTGETWTSSPCQAYQQAPDGSWKPLPCREVGAGAQTQHKSATRSSDQETR
jgi:hypothetical protein